MVRQNDGSNTVDNRTGGFNSFGIAVPLGKGMALAASLRPYSAVGYDFQQSGKDSAFGDWIQRYTGRGGVNASAITWAWSPIKYVSVGATARYLFGSADRSTKVYFLDPRFDYAGKVERVLVSDWRWSAGGQLILPIGMNELIAGIQYEPKVELSAIQNYNWYSFKTNSEGGELPLDTITALNGVLGSVAMGGRQAIGLRWASNRKNALLPAWSLSGHLEQTKVGDHRDFNQSTSGSYQGSYVASFRSDRYGLYVNDTELKGWSGNIGLAMPVGGRSFIPGDVKVSTLHFGLNFGVNGSVTNGLVREQYLRGTVGLTLNDQWFMKAKFR